MGKPEAAAAAAAMAAVEEGHPLINPQTVYGVPASPPPLQADPFNPPQPYILIPIRRRVGRGRHRCACCGLCPALLSSTSSVILLAVCLLLLASSIFLLWPSDPEVRVERLDLSHIRVLAVPTPVIDIDMTLRVRIRNPDFFALDYKSLDVSIAYRGRRLGMVTSAGGKIKARGTSYVDANLRLNGIRVIHDVFYLIADLASGSIPFDTVTEVDGNIHVLFVDVPIHGIISCAVTVNPGNQSVTHHDCYPQ